MLTPVLERQRTLRLEAALGITHANAPRETRAANPYINANYALRIFPLQTSQYQSYKIHELLACTLTRGELPAGTTCLSHP